MPGRIVQVPSDLARFARDAGARGEAGAAGRAALSGNIFSQAGAVLATAPGSGGTTGGRAPGAGAFGGLRLGRPGSRGQLMSGLKGAGKAAALGFLASGLEGGLQRGAGAVAGTVGTFLGGAALAAIPGVGPAAAAIGAPFLGRLAQAGVESLLDEGDEGVVRKRAQATAAGVLDELAGAGVKVSQRDLESLAFRSMQLERRKLDLQRRLEAETRRTGGILDSVSFSSTAWR